MAPARLSRIHARFDRQGVDEWAAEAPPGTPLGATCCHNYELTQACYDRLFALLRAAAGRGAPRTLVDLGAGCGRGVAHAVGSGAFASATAPEVVPRRVESANAALRDLGLTKRAVVTLQSFCDPTFRVEAACATAFDIAFDRTTQQELAALLARSPACLAFASFRSPSRWASAGLTGFEVTTSERVRTSGGERFTVFIFKKVGPTAPL
jgi:hypothetical protein